MIRTNYRCVQSPNITLDIAKCVEMFHKFTQYTHFLSVTKKDLSWLNNLFMVLFQLMMMSSYAKNKLQLCSVTQHQCRHRQMWGNFSQIHPVHSLLSVTKNDRSWWNNLFMVMLQLMMMSSYAKNKLQMCSVTQHQCRHRQMWGKFSQIQKVRSLLVCYKKWLVMTELSIHGNVSTH